MILALFSNVTKNFFISNYRKIPFALQALMLWINKVRQSLKVLALFYFHVCDIRHNINRPDVRCLKEEINLHKTVIDFILILSTNQTLETWINQSELAFFSCMLLYTCILCIYVTAEILDFRARLNNSAKSMGL